MKQIIRGDVIYIDLGQHPKSSIQSGVRPCVVVSNDTNNKYAKVLCVCPCTSNISKNYIPTQVVIEPITVVSKNKVISKVGHIPEDSDVMEQINNAIARQLGFESTLSGRMTV